MCFIDAHQVTAFLGAECLKAVSFIRGLAGPNACAYGVYQIICYSHCSLLPYFFPSLDQSCIDP